MILPLLSWIVYEPLFSTIAILAIFGRVCHTLISALFVAESKKVVTKDAIPPNVSATTALVVDLIAPDNIDLVIIQGSSILNSVAKILSKLLI